MSQIPLSLAQVLLVPLAFVPIAYAAGLKMGKKTGWVVCIPLLYSVLLLGNTAVNIMGGGSVRESYVWAPEAGLSFGLLADGLSIWIVLTVAILCLLISIYSMNYMEHSFHEAHAGESHSGEHEGGVLYAKSWAAYYSLYLLYAVGMMGTVLATNLIQFYLFYELMLVPSWALINNYGTGEKERIGMMYFLWTHVGAVILLVGILSTYWITGSF